MMSDNLLYFISIIARALQSPDVDEALRDAFCQIKDKGIQDRYVEGYRNFELFMQEVYNRYQITATDNIRELIARLGTGMFEGHLQEKESLLNIINSHPQWKAEYESFCRMEAHEDLTQDFPVIALLSEKVFVREITFTKVSGRESIDNIVPGNYKLKLVNTGWIIWEGHLTAEKLISSEAHKNKNLSLAAGAPKPTGEIDPLDNGELILRTYAGTESGRIKIELTNQEGFKNG
jgi:hypothetical protein